LRRELAAELGRSQSAQLVLLDVASFIHLQGDESDQKTALQALLAIQPESSIIVANFDQLFRLTHGLAGTGDSRLLQFIERTFLGTERSVFIAEHSLTLTPTLIGAFLYGTYGLEGKRHLQRKLPDPQHLSTVLEILKWVGLPDSVAAVSAVKAGQSDYEVFARVLTFMMVAGGPQGRAAMLNGDPKMLDPQAKEYTMTVH